MRTLVAVVLLCAASLIFTEQAKAQCGTITINPVTGFLDCTGTAGTGTVTDFTAGTLSPIFTTSVANGTSAPALSFILTNAAAHRFLGNNTGSSAAPGYQQVMDADLGFTDVTTGNASTSNHGFLLKLSNNAGQFLNGQGAWAAPAGGGDTLAPAANTDAFFPRWDGANSKTLLNGVAGVSTATATSLVLRDASANFAAGTITATLTGNVTGALTGNASTATALASNPSDCGAGTVANVIAASGNLTCVTVTKAYVDSTIQTEDNTPALPGGSGFLNYTTGSPGSLAAVAAAPMMIRPCEMQVFGALPELANADDSPFSCKNMYGATLTITSVRCWADAGSPTVDVVISGGATILTGAITCDQTAGGTAGTLDGAQVQTSNQMLDLNITSAGGVAKEVIFYIVRTL